MTPMTLIPSTLCRGICALSCATLLGLATPASAETPKDGGTLRLLARAAAGTADPQINYTAQYWQIAYILYDGLVSFAKAGGAAGLKVVPDLAIAMPKITDGGKTYHFKLRKGLKFSNGQTVTVKDVVASFQRIFKVSSPTAGSFYNGIIGADACLKTPEHCTLAGGIEGDEATGEITIHLTAPDSEFLQKLALPHADILPADTPSKDMGTIPIPGTGPYKIESYDANNRMRLVRNSHFKEWSKAAQPKGHVDAINYNYGLTEEAEVTAVENGQADWMFDPPPPDRLAEIGSKYAKQVALNTLSAMWYVPMNTKLAPFNDIRARQAVNYAIDRKALVKLFGGPNLARPACQILPPGFPSYKPYCPYTIGSGPTWKGPDMAKAKALVDASGTKGQKVTIITEDTTVSKSIGIYLQGVLKKLGYDTSVKSISQNIQFTYIQNTNNKVQMSVSQWFADYPAASDFLHILFSCGAFHPGSDSSINISGFCNKDIDAKMNAAMANTDPAKAAVAWTAVDREVTDKAPVAVLFTPKRVDFVSKRVRGFAFNTQAYWLLNLAWLAQ